MGFRFYVGSTEFFPHAGTRLEFRNRGVDVLSVLSIPSGVLSGGDQVRVTYTPSAVQPSTSNLQPQTVFVGTVEQITASSLPGTDSSVDAVVSSPWAKLERLVYQQQWMDYAAQTAVWSSNLVLNQDLNGDSIGFKTQLNDIFNFAKTRVGCTATAIAGGQALPFDEVRDLSCAQAINRVLRWFPKKIVRFDYSSGTPNLELADPEAASWIASIDKSSVVRTTSAHPITGVFLETVTTGEDDGTPYRKIGRQVYPANADPTDVDVLHATIQLAGSSSSTTREKLRVHCDDEIDPSNPGWWKKYHPRLAKARVQDITVKQWSMREDPDDYPNKADASVEELLKFGLNARVETFTAQIDLKENNDGDREEDLVLQMKFVTTNAEDDKTYVRTVGATSTTGETIPANLARAIYEDRAGSLLSLNCSVRLGSTIPRVGETNEGLVLQSVEIDPLELTASCSFGQSEHLSPEDMASLLSGFRNRIRSTSCWERSEGARGGDEEPPKVIGPTEATEFAPGAKARVTVKSATGGGKILLDPAKLAANKTVDVHTITVGNTTVKVLAEGDITIPGGGGSSGYTGTIRVATGEQRCNSASGYYLQSEYITCNVENGVIKSVVLDDQGNPKKEWTTGLQTIPLSDAR